MNNKTSLTIGAVIVFVGLFVFIGLNSKASNRQSSNTVAGGSHSVTAGNTASAENAPDFSLSKLGGGNITLAEYKGEKPVILDFFATWCPNCRRDMPKLDGYYRKYKDKVEVIGIDLQEKESKVKDFVSSRGISFPIALDPRGVASRSYGVRYTNFHVLISKDGSIVRVIPGDIKESDILSLIDENR